MHTLWSVISALTILGASASTLHLLLHYRRSSAAIAWLFAVWVLPVIGSLLYVMFAVYEGPRRVRRRKRLSRKVRSFERRAAPLQRSAAAEDPSLLSRISDRVGALPVLHGNAVELHADAAAAKADVLELLAGARREILLESYIWMKDAFTAEISRLLCERASRGVNVRVLLDGIGSRARARNGVRALAHAGVQSASYLAPNPFKGRFQINFRNHRKLLVVDGSTAVLGGRNFAAPYFDDEGIRDLSVRVAGPAAGVLRGLFLEDWVVATEGPDEELETTDLPGSRGSVALRVIPHGCDEECDAYVPLLSAALRTARESILVVTPYFIPGPTLLHELRLAALSGVRVRVLLPRRSPERWPEIAARRFFEPLLTAGVEFWIRPAPFLHAKAVVVDETRSFVGSANFDQRSFYLNYELSCAISDERFSQTLARYFEPDFGCATRLDPKEFLARRWYRRAVENTAALFAPIL